MAESIPPLRVREADGSPNVIPVFDMILSGATLTNLGAGVVRVLIDSGAGGTGAPTDAPYVTWAANAALTAERILTAGSSVTIVTDATAIYVNALTGGGASTVYAATGNQYVTISAAADLTDEYTLASGTGIIVTSASNVVYVSNSAKAIRLPLALLTVQPDSANAFWVATTLPLLDMAHVGFVDGGEGVATYWGLVPYNLHPDPNWNLYFYHMTNAGAGGNAIVTVRGAAVTHAESLAYSVLQSAGSYATQAATTLTISAVSSGSLDPALTVASGDLLFVEVNRHGGNTNDTVGQQWNLVSLAVQCNVL